MFHGTMARRDPRRLIRRSPSESGRPDPLLQATDQLKTWFKDEAWRTGRELLEKLQVYPDGLLRTIQLQSPILAHWVGHVAWPTFHAGPRFQANVMIWLLSADETTATGGINRSALRFRQRISLLSSGMLL